MSAFNSKYAPYSISARVLPKTPLWELTAPPDPLAGFKRPTSRKGGERREEKGEENRKGKEERDEHGGEEKGLRNGCWGTPLT